VQQIANNQQVRNNELNQDYLFAALKQNYPITNKNTAEYRLAQKRFNEYNTYKDFTNTMLKEAMAS
jgi:hypothetical protein